MPRAIIAAMLLSSCATIDGAFRSVTTAGGGTSIAGVNSYDSRPHCSETSACRDGKVCDHGRCKDPPSLSMASE